MHQRFVLALFLGCSLCSPLIGLADSPAAKPSSLNGTWVVTSMEQVGVKLEGKQLPVAMRGMKRIFEKQRMTVRRGDREYKCTITLDDEKIPKHLDVTLAREGAKAQTLKCIYEIKGDTLKLAESRQERPESFETDGTMRRVIVYTLTRVKGRNQSDLTEGSTTP